VNDVEVDDLARFSGRTVLVIVAHADDPTLFLGGTIARWADVGARVVVLRVTDDARDSVGLTAEETAARNSREFRDAAALLRIADIVELGYPTDTLGDVSETELRERFIYHVRRLEPYAVVSYDPYGAFHEDNQDHLRVAAAVDETYWTAMFDKHHPEHFAEGLAPHGVYERWYFARRLVEVTTAVDIGAALDRKIEAVLAHDTMMRNLVHQLRLQARTAGHRLPALEDAQHGPLRALLGPLVRHGAATTGRSHDLAYAEQFRVVRFGGLEELLLPRD
jgi:LmbE family N-acetylglucosaminyl deacetylase